MKTNDRVKLAIVVPPYYTGTSFEDIVDSLRISANRNYMSPIFIGDTLALKNLPNKNKLLDDHRYIKGQLKLLENTIKKLPDLDKILFIDFFNPGLDLIKYSIIDKIKQPKFYSLLHGGSFFDGDLYSANWFKNFERGWFDVYDRIYAPSNFAKISCPQEYWPKLTITTWGMESFNKKQSSNKKQQVIFPHRLQTDKGIEDLLEIIKRLSNINFLITTPQSKRKSYTDKIHNTISSYSNVSFAYNVDNNNIAKYLAQSQIVLSCSRQETFGYSIMKAIACDCYPVLPNRASYPEFFSSEFLYNNIDECCEMIFKALNYGRQLQKVKTKNQPDSLTFDSLLKDFYYRD